MGTTTTVPGRNVNHFFSVAVPLCYQVQTLWRKTCDENHRQQSGNLSGFLIYLFHYYNIKYTFTDHALYSQNINYTMYVCILLSQNCITDINYYPGVCALNYGTGCVSWKLLQFLATPSDTNT